MSDVTRILSQLENGDNSSSDQLLPLVYDELRKLAAARLPQEKPGQTLQATALVHEAYMRLVDVEKAQHWDSRGHFFSAAAEAMRRILIERHRAKSTQKRGGDLQRVELQDVDDGAPNDTFDLIALDEAIQDLHKDDADAAELVKLRIFAGLSVEQAAQALDMPRTSAFRTWTFAQAWLRSRLSDGK